MQTGTWQLFKHLTSAEAGCKVLSFKMPQRLQLGFAASPLPPRRFRRSRSTPQVESRPTFYVCASTPENYPARTSVSRRQVLALAAAIASVSIFPKHANALSKKRILAKAGPTVELPSGVTYRDIAVGKGFTPRAGDTVAIHYSLFYEDLEVESSRESQGLAASPVGFTFGATSGPGSIIPGINVGMEGMKVGGLRLITVPPQLAYGEKGKKPLIPSNSTVDFAVSLLSVKRSGTNPISTINPKAQVF